MYSDNPIILQLISLLKQFNIRKIVISPGGRHVQLSLSLEADPFFQLYSVVDERSAAFFALGLIMETGEPVAIACTSGTACINYSSGVAEAYYQHLPLLILSADRLPHLLNQEEDQMLDQIQIFKKITKFQANLPHINNELDKWWCNRLINEALNNLTVHGSGPVQINFPIKDIYGNNFEVMELPKVRKININSALHKLNYSLFAEKLQNKKIILIWGQSVAATEDLIKAIYTFVSDYSAIILTDPMSNCPIKGAIKNSLGLLHGLTFNDRQFLTPDIVITFGGSIVFNDECKRLCSESGTQHWSIDPSGDVSDPFHNLTEVFEMDELNFFNSINDYMNSEAVSEGSVNFKNLWVKLSEELPEPRLEPYNQLTVIGRFIKNLPSRSSLHLANSNAIRFASCYSIPDDIKIFCNRGLNGIDGSMSSAIGFACCSSSTTFYITGDLSFFYDMNSLTIKHLSPNLRILLINNYGGGFMYNQRRIVNGEKSLTLAADNKLEVKKWVESVGFTYYKAHNNDEVEQGIMKLVNPESDNPIILEVFTDIKEDGYLLWNYYRTLDNRTLLDKIKGKLHQKFSK